MAGPVEGTFQAAVVDVAPATASPEAVLGRGVSDLQAPAMVTATSSRTRPGSRRAGVEGEELAALHPFRHQRLDLVVEPLALFPVDIEAFRLAAGQPVDLVDVEGEFAEGAHVEADQAVEAHGGRSAVELEPLDE